MGDMVEHTLADIEWGGYLTRVRQGKRNLWRIVTVGG
jgi:hypothetical protein